MFNTIKITAAALALSAVALPAVAQDAEEPRTTYSVTALEFTDDADQNRWLELRGMVDAARAQAGLPADTVHWVMLNEDWDILIVSEMPEGMAAFDTHGSPSRAAFIEALTELAGGEDGLEAMREEADAMIEERHTIYTHTHP
ncbi:hypothetical protein [Aurantiacibacter gilvus]|uniref:Uncharacterized protein n=1 Tax=Aurantiacibacter gilvus TaxID=3139141 RepID=A0ABU9IDX2_9SPHN